MDALILFAHGSRDPQWAAPFHAIRQKVSRHTPGLSVELAFLELMRPTLPEAAAGLIAAGHTRLTVAPLFMAQGAHVTRDLTRLMDTLSAQHRGIELVVLPPLGQVDAVLEAISAWLASRAGGARWEAEVSR